MIEPGDIFFNDHYHFLILKLKKRYPISKDNVWIAHTFEAGTTWELGEGWMLSYCEKVC